MGHRDKEGNHIGYKNRDNKNQITWHIWSCLYVYGSQFGLFFNLRKIINKYAPKTDAKIFQKTSIRDAILDGVKYWIVSLMIPVKAKIIIAMIALFLADKLKVLSKVKLKKNACGENWTMWRILNSVFCGIFLTQPILSLISCQLMTARYMFVKMKMIKINQRYQYLVTESNESLFFIYIRVSDMIWKECRNAKG